MSRRQRRAGAIARRPLVIGLVALATLIGTPVGAMGFKVAPPFLYLSGPVVYEDWPLWQETLAQHGKAIETVVLHDSPGGDALAGQYIALNLRLRKLKTVVGGACMSACANIFIAGVERQFAPRGTSPGLLGFHGSYRESGKLRRRSEGDYYLRMTGWKMSEALILRFINLDDSAGALMFADPEHRLRPGRAPVMLCEGAAVRARRIDQCEVIEGTDALAQGVVTSWELREVGALPTPWKAKSARLLSDGPPVPATANDEAFPPPVNPPPK